MNQPAAAPVKDEEKEPPDGPRLEGDDDVGGGSKSYTDWSTDQVIEWLEETNPVIKKKYEKAFRDQGVDGKMLESMDDSTLKEELGVSSTMHRKRLLDAIGDLGSKNGEKIFWFIRVLLELVKSAFCLC